MSKLLYSEKYFSTGVRFNFASLEWLIHRGSVDCQKHDTLVDLGVYSVESSIKILKCGLIGGGVRERDLDLEVERVMEEFGNNVYLYKMLINDLLASGMMLLNHTFNFSDNWSVHSNIEQDSMYDKILKFAESLDYKINEVEQSEYEQYVELFYRFQRIAFKCGCSRSEFLSMNMNDMICLIDGHSDKLETSLNDSLFLNLNLSYLINKAVWSPKNLPDKAITVKFNGNTRYDELVELYNKCYPYGE